MDPIDEAAARAFIREDHQHCCTGTALDKLLTHIDAHDLRCMRVVRLAILRGMLERGPPTTLLAIYNDVYYREGDAFCHGDFKRTISAEIDQLTKESP